MADTIVDDLVHTMQKPRRLRLRRRPFAICICEEKRERLIDELRDRMSFKNVEDYLEVQYRRPREVKIMGAQIGSIVPCE